MRCRSSRSRVSRGGRDRRRSGRGYRRFHCRHGWLAGRFLERTWAGSHESLEAWLSFLGCICTRSVWACYTRRGEEAETLRGGGGFGACEEIGQLEFEPFESVGGRGWGSGVFNHSLDTRAKTICRPLS